MFNIFINSYYILDNIMYAVIDNVVEQYRRYFFIKHEKLSTYSSSFKLIKVYKKSLIIMIKLY